MGSTGPPLAAYAEDSIEMWGLPAGAVSERLERVTETSKPSLGSRSFQTVPVRVAVPAASSSTKAPGGSNENSVEMPGNVIEWLAAAGRTAGSLTAEVASYAGSSMRPSQSLSTPSQISSEPTVIVASSSSQSTQSAKPSPSRSSLSSSTRPSPSLSMPSQTSSSPPTHSWMLSNAPLL